MRIPHAINKLLKNKWYLPKTYLNYFQHHQGFLHIPVNSEKIQKSTKNIKNENNVVVLVDPLINPPIRVVSHSNNNSNGNNNGGLNEEYIRESILNAFQFRYLKYLQI